MNPKENKHYVNKHGQQLKNFMIKEFGLEQYRIWCKLNAFKYQARAGKKEDNSEDKDLKKRDDYLDEIYNIPPLKEWAIQRLEEQAKEFEEWKGKEVSDY